MELAAKLKLHLSNDYVVDVAHLGEDALQLLRYSSFDLIVLDWSLPDITGLQICKRFRSSGGKTPVLILTGMDDVEHKELGLDSGADDYLTKPFQMRELAARLRSLIRRSSGANDNQLTVSGIELRKTIRLVVAGSKSVRLTQKECGLFEFFIRHPNTYFSASDLRSNVWPADSESEDQTVRTIIKNLRQKLDQVGHPDLIKTVLGSGYILESS